MLNTLLRYILRHGSKLLLLLLPLCLYGETRAEQTSVLALPADVFVVGDTRLKQVIKMIDGIKESMGKQVPVYTPVETKGRLPEILERHEAQTVIALGHAPIEEALTLPPSVTVIYGLVALPPETHRLNTVGIFMGTPSKEYLNITASNFPCLKKICAIASPSVFNALCDSCPPNVTLHRHQARTPFQFVEALKILDGDALLLLPDTSLLTKRTLKEAYLFSFRHKLPLLGLSRVQVQQGTLFALEFNPKCVGHRLGKLATASMKEGNSPPCSVLPPKHFDLYLNRSTAKMMGITIPDKLLRIAKSVYM